MSDTQLYYEAHVTVKPHGKFHNFGQWLNERNWKASVSEAGAVDDAAGTWFGSARSPSKPFLFGQVVGVVKGLEKFGFEVTRWKVEEIVWDSKHGDTLASALKELRGIEKETTHD